MGDRKWKLAQEVRRWWLGLHATPFSLDPGPTRPRVTAAALVGSQLGLSQQVRPLSLGPERWEPLCTSCPAAAQ